MKLKPGDHIVCKVKGGLYNNGVICNIDTNDYYTVLWSGTNIVRLQSKGFIDTHYTLDHKTMRNKTLSKILKYGI